MSILEVTTVINGFPGGPGYTLFHTTNAGLITTAVDNSVEAARKFFFDIRQQMTGAMTAQVQQDVRELDPANGDLIAIHSAGSLPAAVIGLAAALGSGASGACISWGTGGVNRGRRVRGRTFVVPLPSTAYDADGTLTSVCLDALNTAATNYRTSSAYESLIWSRPRAPRPQTVPPTPASGGAAFPILSHHVTDKAAVLRSRRD